MEKDDKSNVTNLAVKKPKKAAKTKNNVIALKPIVQGEYFTVAEDRSSVTIELYQEIENGNEQISELVLRRSQIGDLADAFEMKGGEDVMQRSLNKFSLLTGLPVSVIEQIDETEDVPVLLEATEAFRSIHEYKNADDNPLIRIAEDKQSCTIKLVHPVEYINRKGDDVTIESLVMQRPKLADSNKAAKKAPQNTYLQDIYRWAELCNVSVNVIRQIDEADDRESLVQAAELFRGRRNKRRKR